MSVFYDVEPNSAEHQRLRLGLFTSSCMDQLLTPKKRQISSQAPLLMYRKLAERVSGEPLEFEQMSPRPWMERGQQLEDEAIRCYEALKEADTKRGGFWTDDDGNIGASPDRLVGEDGLLEIKCPLLPKQIETALTGQYDDHTGQLQGQLYVTGRKWVDVFSYHPTIILDPHRVVRDEDFIRDLERALKVFVEELLKRYAELEKRFGPFPAPVSIVPPPREDDPMFVSEADLDAIFAQRHRAQELRDGPR